MKYDMAYNLTEEIRHLLDADYTDIRTGQKDLGSFETAKKHILLLIGKEDVDIAEYTAEKQKLISLYFKGLKERLTQPEDELLIQQLGQDLYAFNEAYNAITLKYMEDTVKLLLEHVRK